MKLCNLGFGLAVVAAATFVSGVAEAATLSFSDGSINLNAPSFEFEFVSSKGWFKSSLFVADAATKANVQTLFSETQFFVDNSPLTGPSAVTSGSWSAGNGNFVLGLSSIDVDNTVKPTVYSDQVNPFQFKLLSSVNNLYTFGIEDKRGPQSGADYDYNDGVFKVRAVPVPAVVPGIALAAAFFGSKAMKRNKKNVKEVVS